jgi:hypothetical protein
VVLVRWLRDVVDMPLEDNTNLATWVTELALFLYKSIEKLVNLIAVSAAVRCGAVVGKVEGM